MDNEYALKDGLINVNRWHGLADEEYTADVNLGPPCRFMPALMDQSRHKYTLFIDDDLLPGKRVVEHFLKAAETVNDEFATLGQIGRYFKVNGDRAEYIKRNVGRGLLPMPVDMTCRAHFVHTLNVFHAGLWAGIAGSSCPAGAPHRNDDISLCLGIATARVSPTPLPLQCFLTPADEDPETSIRLAELPDNDSISRLPDHLSSRNEYASWFVARGWKSCRPR